MLDIVMLVHNRPRLTAQALESLIEHTTVPHTLTLVDDASGPETQDLLNLFIWKCPMTSIRSETRQGPGVSRNAGIEASSYAFRRQGLLYLCDNDCFFLPGWDATLLEVWNGDLRRREGFEAIGGYCHPFQQPIRQMRATAGHSLSELEALGLLSWLMAWETWDAHGPFEPSTTINGSEDWLMCQKIRKAGGRVGVVTPHVIVNCGATSSDGRVCPGVVRLFEQDIPAGVRVE